MKLNRSLIGWAQQMYDSLSPTNQRRAFSLFGLTIITIKLKIFQKTILEKM